MSAMEQTNVQVVLVTVVVFMVTTGGLWSYFRFRPEPHSHRRLTAHSVSVMPSIGIRIRTVRATARIQASGRRNATRRVTTSSDADCSKAATDGRLSAWLLRGNLLRPPSGFGHRRELWRFERDPAQGLMEVRFEQATINSEHDRGRGGSGGSFRLRDGGQRSPTAASRTGPAAQRRPRRRVPRHRRLDRHRRRRRLTSTILAAAKDGTKSVDLNGFGPGAIEQTFATTINSTYVVQFWMSGNPGTHEQYPNGDASPADQDHDRRARRVARRSSYSFDTTKGNTFGDMMWADEAYSFKATSATTTLTFASTTAGAFGPAHRPRHRHRDRRDRRQLQGRRLAGHARRVRQRLFKNQGACVSFYAKSGATPIGR